jgi:hypothetical protein
MLEICLGIVILLPVLERSGFSQGAVNCLGSRSKPAKTVTSLLIIPSVLYVVFYFFYLVGIYGIGSVVSTKQSYPLNLIPRDELGKNNIK